MLRWTMGGSQYNKCTRPRPATNRWTKCPPIMSGNPPHATSDDAIKAICLSEELAKDQFVAFRQLYHESTRLDHGADSVVTIDDYGLTSHASVLRTVTLLRAECHQTLDSFRHLAFPRCPPAEGERATRTTVMLAYAIDPSSRDDYSRGFKVENEDTFPVKWQQSQTFVQFVQSAFPTTTQTPWPPSRTKSGPRAWKLKQRYGISIIPTNDLVQHLMYNPTHRTLSIFHQVEYLKSHARQSAQSSLSESVEQSLKKQVNPASNQPPTRNTNPPTHLPNRGTLPPQLILETLYSIYNILLPVATNKKSVKFVKRLIRDSDTKASFDHNLLVHEIPVSEIPEDFQFIYWAKRLRNLESILVNPPPANPVISWIERHTTERNALTAALVGLFLSVLFGLLGALIGLAQLVMSYYAWKYPI